MKKKYLLFSLLFIILLTGCSAKYSLKIKDNTIKETFKVYGNSDDDRIMKKDEFGKAFYDYSRIYGENINIETDYYDYNDEEKCNSNCSFYQKKYINDQGILGFELTHEFSFYDYSTSSVATELIPSFSSTYDGRYLIISGGPNWNLFKEYKDLDEIDFEIETNYKVVSTNLEKVKDGKYKWTIKEDDSKLYIDLDTSVIVNNKVDNNNNNIVTILIIFVSLLVVALIVCIIKEKKKNY